jgi:hypothetical protein
VRYWDPGNARNTQWELYNLELDPNEDHNLLAWDKDTGAPVPRAAQIAALGLAPAQVDAAVARLRGSLNEAMRKAGYGPESAQALGYVQDGMPPAT